MRPSEVLTRKRNEVLAVIARHPFTNPRVFGSVARGEDTEQSDVDLLVDNIRPISLFDLAGLEIDLVDLLGLRVDVFTPESLKSRVLSEALRDQKPL